MPPFPILSFPFPCLAFFSFPSHPFPSLPILYLSLSALPCPVLRHLSPLTSPTSPFPPLPSHPPTNLTQNPQLTHPSPPGGFLHYLTEDWSSSDRYPGTGWANTEFRSYTFSALEPEAAHLVETPESRQRRRGGNGTATGTGMDEKPLDREEVAQWRRTGEKDEERREKEREREVGGRRERAASEGKAREARELLAKV